MSWKRCFGLQVESSARFGLFRLPEGQGLRTQVVQPRSVRPGKYAGLIFSLVSSPNSGDRFAPGSGRKGFAEASVPAGC